MTNRRVQTEQDPGPQAFPWAEDSMRATFDRREWAAKAHKEVLYLQQVAQQIDVELRRLQLLQRNTCHTGLLTFLAQADLERLVLDIEKYRCELEMLSQKFAKLEQGNSQNPTELLAPAPITRNETGR